MRSWIYVVMATCLFSSMEVALKGMVGVHGPVQVNVTRFLVGAFFLLPFAVRELKKRRLLPSRKELLELSWLGFLGIVISLTMYQLAVERIPANVVAVIFCCNTVFVLLFSALFLRTHIHRLQCFALVFSLLGILAIIDPLHTELSCSGLVLAVAAPIFFALYSVFGARLTHRLGGVSVTCLSFFFGSAELLLCVALGHSSQGATLLTALGLPFFVSVDLLGGYTPLTFALMSYVSVGVSGCGFACYFLAAQTSSPMRASLAFFFKPILAPLLCLFLLGEALTLNILLGMLLVLMGSVLSIWDQLRLIESVKPVSRQGTSVSRTSLFRFLFR